MIKSRGSLEPFWDLKISKINLYVEYLTHVSMQRIHYKLSATFSEKYL